MDHQVDKALAKADSAIARLKNEREANLQAAQHAEAVKNAVISNLREVLTKEKFHKSYQQMCNDSFYSLVADDIIANVPEDSKIFLAGDRVIFVEEKKPKAQSFFNRHSRTYLKAYKPPSFEEVVREVIHEKTNWGAFFV